MWMWTNRRRKWAVKMKGLIFVFSIYIYYKKYTRKQHSRAKIYTFLPSVSDDSRKSSWTSDFPWIFNFLTDIHQFSLAMNLKIDQHRWRKKYLTQSFVHEEFWNWNVSNWKKQARSFRIRISFKSFERNNVSNLFYLK